MTAEGAAKSEAAASRAWLAALKDQAGRGERPRDKAVGRWLGDFLNQDSPSGLLPTELELLEACAAGRPCEPALRAAVPEPAPNKDAEQAGEARRRAALEDAVQNRVVRAGFLRFLTLRGDELAPIHEMGIELYDALIDDALDLRGGQCVGRLALVRCVLRGVLSIEDASLGVLVLSGSRLAGVKANRARISGTVLLDSKFVCDGDVQMFSTQIGGSLICTSAQFNGDFTCARARIGADLICESGVFAHGIMAQGAVVGGDAKFSWLRAKRPVSLANADIGGSLRCSGATFAMDAGDATEPAKVMLDFSRATIKSDVTLDSPAEGTAFTTQGAVQFSSARIGGDVYLWGASITAVGPEEDGRMAVNGQNVKVAGSLYFCGGFQAQGVVSLSGAEISKDLDFSDGAFRNQSGYAIIADWSKVSGVLKFQTTDPAPGGHAFQSFGVVSVVGAECGEMRCNGGTFSNPGSVALDAGTIDVKGSVFLQNVGARPFEARGLVRLFTARIGQHLYCGGGRFLNPGGEALNCEGGRIAGCVFLNACDSNGVEPKDRPGLAFQADGKVTFVGAYVGLQFNCQWGRFRNATPDRSNGAYADAALQLSTAVIVDTLFLGVDRQSAHGEDPDSQPVTIEGGLDLTATTVRVLVDDGLVGDAQRGLRPTVDGQDGRTRACNLTLDLFSYERVKGERACKARDRKDWLARQPPEDLKQAFKPQPYEQLIKVLRGMGQDDEADEIALAKRTHARRARPWWTPSRGVASVRDFLAKLGELIFVAWFLGYGYKIGRALGILLALGIGFGAFYALAFAQGAIAPADKDIRGDRAAASCPNWSPAACPAVRGAAIPLFNPWIYSADVMIPIIGLGQKSAWTPTHDRSLDLPIVGPVGRPTSLVNDMQLAETVLGWIGGILLLSFVSGLIAKE